MRYLIVAIITAVIVAIFIVKSGTHYQNSNTDFGAHSRDLGERGPDLGAQGPDLGAPSPSPSSVGTKVDAQKSVRKIVLSAGKPYSVDVEISEGVRRALLRKEGRVSLVTEIYAASRLGVVSFRVFLNCTENKATYEISNSCYVNTVSTFASGKSRVEVDISEMAQRLYNGQPSLRVTLLMVMPAERTSAIFALFPRIEAK